MTRICFIIDKLNRGGTERQFIELIKGLDRKRFIVSIIILHEGGHLRPELDTSHGLALYTIPRKGPLNALAFFIKLYALLRKLRPEIIHGYLGGTNEICLLMGRLIGSRVVWGIRSANLDLSHYGWRSKVLFVAGATFSRYADLAIFNSSAGRNYHAAHGYSAKRMTVIPNGINTGIFFPDPVSRKDFRKTLGIRGEEIVIGLVGRIDPMKDYETFLQAAARISSQRNDLRFICVGYGENTYVDRLKKHALDLGLEDKIYWTGMCTDMPAVYNGLDILTSSSYGEGFSNVIGEAMACGKICVVTNVGDSAAIIGETGVVVPSRDPDALVRAWNEVLALSRDDRCRQSIMARARIMENFTIEHLVNKTTEQLLATL